MPMPSRTLLILRHAKSDWATTDPNDHDRPLAKRGRLAARELAELIPAAERPELILCSSARRAIETLAGISPLLDGTALVSIEHGLYLADEDALLARLHQLPLEVSSAMVIGHNPSLHDLAIRVIGEGDPEVVESLAENLATGGLVTLSQPGDWTDLDTGSARLVRYVVPENPRG